MFLVDWYGRADFQFHIFYHLGVVDPDTGVNYGLFDESLTRAWGGHSGPTWFYDLSAGPDWDDNSYDVDDADFDADGVTEYRMPPIWEYGTTNAYRPFNDLSGDLAKVVRYVAIDMLFTPSPIYDPAATVPGPDGAKQLQINVFEGDPASNGLENIHADTIAATSHALEPYYDVTAGATDQPLTGGVLDAYEIAAGKSATPPAAATLRPGRPQGFPEAELDCYFSDHRAQYFPTSPGNAVIPVSDFTVPQYVFDFTGIAAADFRTGLPSYITELDVAPPAGYVRRAPMTMVTVHEAGHFVGLEHPFDGWDSSRGVQIEPEGAYNFAWDADETATPMSYLYGQGSLTFSWFDRENVARWYVGRLLDLADTDAAAILARRHGDQADALLGRADGEFGTALVAMRRGDWNAAATAAVAGYRDMQRADALSGVTPASNRLAELEGSAPRHPDRKQEGSGHALAPRVLHSTLTGKGTTPILATPSGFSPE